MLCLKLPSHSFTKMSKTLLSTHQQDQFLISWSCRMFCAALWTAISFELTSVSMSRTILSANRSNNASAISRACLPFGADGLCHVSVFTPLAADNLNTEPFGQGKLHRHMSTLLLFHQTRLNVTDVQSDNGCHGPGFLFGPINLWKIGRLPRFY